MKKKTFIYSNLICDLSLRSKPVVIPTLVNVTDIHEIISFRGDYMQCVMSPSEGLLHHYRAEKGKRSRPEGYVYDPYLRTFAADIVQRVDNVMRAHADNLH